MVMNNTFGYGEQKNCIVYSYDNFLALLKNLGGYGMTMGYDSLYFFSLETNEEVSTSQILQKISQKYGIIATSLHHDQFDNIGFWVVYKNKIFTKKDLRSGDFVVRRDGSVEVVLPNLGGMICSNGGFNDLNDLLDDLTFNDTDYGDCDIMQVYRPTTVECCSFNYFKRGLLIFDRRD